MEVMEIIFLILGIVVTIVSFFLPSGEKEETQNAAKISEDAIREMIGKEVDDVKSKIDDIADETITYSMEKAERSMERLTNEKMMAVNEYSDTVLAEINKTHKEVVFLYDMLNDKNDTLKAAVSEAAKTTGEIKQTVKDAEITAREVEAKTKEVRETVSEMVSSIEKARETAAAARTASDAPMEIPGSEGEEKPKGTGKTTRKPRASKSAKKEVKTEEKALPENVMPVEVPEVAVSLNEEGMTGQRNNNERILELHKAGKSNMAIARELGLGIGEVKLVIDLFEGI